MAPAPNALRILLVEDNPVVRSLFAHGLKRLEEELRDGVKTKIQLFQFNDGAAALDHIHANSIDILITDLYLPVMTGFELIKRIREDPEKNTMKILAISSSYTDAKRRSLDAGADYFIQKPLRLVDLLDKLRTMLRIRVE